MNPTKFRQLVVGEKFRLPGSDELMIKERLRQEPGLGWVNARYDNTRQEQLCYFADDTSVVRRRSNEAKESGLKGPPLRYQCIHCQQWVEENNAAMSKEGVMCLDCYTLDRKRKTEPDQDDHSPITLARLLPGQTVNWG